MNFCACALGLWNLGYKAVGVRIDSGDLAHSSSQIRVVLKLVADKSGPVVCSCLMQFLSLNDGCRFQVPWLSKVMIVGSNDINEDILHSLRSQEHEMDAFGIGTHLVTCQKQPALGCVYKVNIPRKREDCSLYIIVLTSLAHCHKM